jgi:hypothetical protein
VQLPAGQEVLRVTRVRSEQCRRSSQLGQHTHEGEGSDRGACCFGLPVEPDSRWQQLMIAAGSNHSRALNQAAPEGASSSSCIITTSTLPADPREKARITHQAWQAYKSGTLPIGTAEAPGAPARPAQPEVSPEPWHRPL